MKNFANTFFHRLAQFILNYPKAIAVTSLILALISCMATMDHLEFDTNQDNLVSNKLAYHQRYLDFITEFSDRENIYVVFQVGENQMEEAKKALLLLVEKIKDKKDYYSKIVYQEDRSVFENRGLLLLPHQNFYSLTHKMDQWASDIQQINAFQDYADLIHFAAQRLSLPSETLKKNAEDFKEGFELLEKLLQGIDDPEKIQKLSRGDLFKPLIGHQFYQDPDGFFVSQNGRLLFLIVEPVKDYSTQELIKDPLSYLRQKLIETRSKFPHIKMGITGRPVLQSDEMASTRSDSVYAGVFAFLGVCLLYFYFFKQGKRPLLSITALLFGMAWTIGITTAVIGHLNLLTIVFAIILIGLGGDYGIHFLFHYQSHRVQGESVESAVENSLLSVGGPTFTAASTAAIAFLSAIFTDFLGLQELGFIAGSGILLCLISQIVTLPAFLILFDKKISNLSKLIPPTFNYFDWILKRTRLVFYTIIIISVLLVPYAFKVRFENNLLKLQDPNLESVQYEHIIIEESDQSTWFAAFITPSQEELQNIKNKVLTLKSVGRTESIFTVIPEDQEQKIKALKDLDQKLNPGTHFMTNTIEPHKLLAALDHFKNELVRVQDLAFKGSASEAVEKIDHLLDITTNLMNKIKNQNRPILNKIHESQNYFLHFLRETLQDLKTNLSPIPLKEDDLPISVKNFYKSPKGNYILYVYPENDIWQPELLQIFVSDLRSINPHVTGSPIQVYESSKRMRQGFYLVGLMTILLVLVILRLDFGNFKDTMIAALPLFVGILWLVICMGYFNLNLNLANFFALPILIGIGIDNGVHMIHLYRKTGSTSEMLHHISSAIILSSLTTILSFGTLSFVRHVGLASFGKLITLGSSSCLIASLLLVPVILDLLENNRKGLH